MQGRQVVGTEWAGWDCRIAAPGERVVERKVGVVVREGRVPREGGPLERVVRTAPQEALARKLGAERVAVACGEGRGEGEGEGEG